MSASASKLADEARVKSASIKERVDLRSAQRKDEKQRQKELELKDCEDFLVKARQVPMDVLAQQWLEDGSKSPETRAYLLEHVLPTLVLGLERLLQHAEQAEGDVNYINWLAQWLTRNNPRFVKPSAATPYVQSLQRVQVELRARSLKA